MTDQYTDEEIAQMCDKAELDNLKARCLVAYWDNKRFGESLIDAPERLEAVFEVLLGWLELKGSEGALEALKKAAGRLDNLPSAQSPSLDSSSS